MTANPKVPCSRCGYPRQLGKNPAPVCKDCRAVLTPQELEVWAA